MSDTFRAALWMIGAIIAFTSMAIAGRAVSHELDTYEIMLFRSLVGIFLVVGVASLCGTLSQINRQQLALHGARNLAHFAGQNLWFYALPILPLAQLFAMEFTTPIWVVLLAPLILKERITPFGLLAAILGFVGVMIVTRPIGTPISPATLAAACAAIGFGITALLTRKLTRTQAITCIMFWLTVMQACFGLVMAGYDGDIALPSNAALPWLIMIGFAGLIAHFCMTSALALAPASIVMPIDFARLPVIAIVAAYFYAEPLDRWVFVGAIVIFGANYLNVIFSTSGSQKRHT